MTTATPTLPAKTDIRGFALYVGVSEEKLLAENTRLSDLVRQIRELIAEVAPEADTHATVALAPEHAGGRDIDIVRLALSDPSLHRPEPAKSEDRVSHVTIDLTRKQVLLDSIPASLTFREFELLQFLVLREGRTVSRDDIVEGLWSHTSDEELPSARTIDVHVRRLRIKLGAYQDIVRTVRGLGYRFDRHADVQILTSGTPSPDRF